MVILMIFSLLYDDFDDGQGSDGKGWFLPLGFAWNYLRRWITDWYERTAPIVRTLVANSLSTELPSNGNVTNISIDAIDAILSSAEDCLRRKCEM